MAVSSRRWRLAAIGLAIGLVAPLGAGTPAAAGPNQADARAAAAKVDKKVTQRLNADGKASFWVYLGSQADVSGAAKLSRKADKAALVYKVKTEHAAKSQAGLRSLLRTRGVDFTPFWLANTIKVTGDSALVTEIAARPEVSSIMADEPVTIPAPAVGEELPGVNGVEWNVDRINAPQVWNTLGVRGEGIVVANIDTGVDYTHPAVAAAYRGRNSDGTFNHNYNWYDPANICPSAAPCDNNNHGTHTMGTMVGLDGTNIIGVAPGAKWIAAKGCESSSCSTASLLAAGQWVIAPTDLAGANPRPDLAPDVVNNSWGASVFDPWYKQTVSGWIAAGIFPAFSNGNSGPSCNTSGSPGSYVISYSSGAFDINNTIASFSSRGAGENGEVKPNIAAPGVNVRSSVPGGYSSFSGTSMASPHTAATVALMWSASPALQGDIAETERILDDTAIDVDNLTCGGTVDDNNVFGEGRLDAFAAVSATPRGPLGDVSGHVTSAGSPVAGATISVHGPLDRTSSTAADGSYAFSRLMVGDYAVTVSKFGYVTATTSVTVVDSQTTTLDVDLQAAPSATIHGTVTTSAGPAAGAKVTVLGTPLTTTADSQGAYQIVAPQGDYDVLFEHAYRCAASSTQHISLTGDLTLNVTLPDRTDAFGYACSGAGGSYQPGTTLFGLTGDDVTAPIALPFAVPFYGKAYRSGWVSTNGVLGFGAATNNRVNTNLPNTATPNLALYPFWDDLVVESDSGIYTAVTGARPHRAFIIEWRNVSLFSNRTQRLSFTLQISEDGSIVYRYKDIDGTGGEAGLAATIGLENDTGTDGFEYSYNLAAVGTGSAIAFRTTRTGVVSGVITDANDGLPVAGALVTAQPGAQAVTDTTGADGTYLIQTGTGSVSLTAARANYETGTASVALTAGGVEERSLALRTAKVTASPTGLIIIAPPGQTRDRQVVLTNSGGIGTSVSVTEADASGAAMDIGWLSLSGATGTMPSGGTQTVGVRVSAAGLPGGTYYQATLRIASASGRNPVFTVPVTLVVPSYSLAIDAGSSGSHADIEGETWVRDRAYTSGGAGYLGNSHVNTTLTTIAGTTDQARFADQRDGMYEYRFDGLADGVYTIELNFAELRTQAPNRRLFDVIIEGQLVLPALDIAGEVGSFTALTKTFTVRVSDGQLNVRFVARKGYGTPIVNGLRVTNRPDLAV